MNPSSATKNNSAALLRLARAATDVASDFFKMIDRTGWRGNEHFDAKRSDSIIAGILRGGGTEKYGGKNITDIFGLYGSMTKIGVELRELLEISDRAVPQATAMFVTTTGIRLGPEYHTEVYKLHASLQRTVSAYVAALADFRPETELGAPADDLAAHKLYHTFIDKSSGHLVVDLYVRILTSCLQDRDSARRIMPLLEDIKTSVLNLNPVEVKNARKGGIQQMLVTYNLRPISDKCMTAAELFAVLGASAKPTKSIVENAEIIGKLLGTSFIIVNRSTKDPAIYKIPGMHPPEFGPTAASVQLTASVIKLSGDIVSMPGITRVGSTDSVYVIDVVAADTYRFLSPYIVAAEAKVAGNNDMRTLPALIPQHAVERMGEWPPSVRVAGYNAIMGDRLLVRMRDPLLGEAPRIDDSFWSNVRNRILDMTMLKLGNGARGVERVAQFVIDAALELLIVDMIPVETTALRRNLYLDEIAVSNAAVVRDMKWRLTAMLHPPINRESLMDVLKRVITSKSNLFKIMGAKNDLLAVTLLAEGLRGK
jgi:hypothetical protein